VRELRLDPVFSFNAGPRLWAEINLRYKAVDSAGGESSVNRNHYVRTEPVRLEGLRGYPPVKWNIRAQVPQCPSLWSPAADAAETSIFCSHDSSSFSTRCFGVCLWRQVIAAARAPSAGFKSRCRKSSTDALRDPATASSTPTATSDCTVTVTSTATRPRLRQRNRQYGRQCVRTETPIPTATATRTATPTATSTTASTAIPTRTATHYSHFYCHRHLYSYRYTHTTSTATSTRLPGRWIVLE